MISILEINILRRGLISVGTAATSHLLCSFFRCLFLFLLCSSSRLSLMYMDMSIPF